MLSSKATYNKCICHKRETTTYLKTKYRKNCQALIWESDLFFLLFFCGGAVMLCVVEVTSEQMCLQSFADDGEWFCCPDIGQEFVPPLRCQNREKLWLRWAGFVWCSTLQWFRWGVQPRGSCRWDDKTWPALGPGVALCLLWGKNRSCRCCRGQIYRIRPQQWCWRCRIIRCQGLGPGSLPSTKVIPWHPRQWLTRPCEGSLFLGWRRCMCIVGVGGRLGEKRGTVGCRHYNSGRTIHAMWLQSLVI